MVALVGAAAATFGGQTNNSFSVPGTESQQAQDLLEKKFPGAGGASARVVFKRPGGRVARPTREHRAAVMESVEKAERAAEVTAVVDPYEAKTITRDGRVGFADVIYPMPAGETREDP